MKKLLTTTALTLGALTAVAYAQMQPTTPGTFPTSAASGTIQYSVAVCDPNSPFHCVAPDGSGNMPVTMSGSSSFTAYGKATTAAPSYTNNTNNPFSLDLSGNLRTSILTALPAGSNTIGAVTQASGPWTSNITQFGSNAVATGTGASGSGIPRVTVSNDSSVLTPVTGIATNPTSTLTRPANTTAYAAGQLIASNTTAGSIVVPSFAIANSAGAAIIPRVRLSTNATTGWGTTLTMNLWTTAPTYTNGDGAAYAVATGGATHVAQFSCALTQYGDAASGECQINVNNFATVKLASGTAVYWDIQATAAATPISGQTFTVTAEVLN